MTTPQTFYAVLDEGNNWYAGPFENANKADAVALRGWMTGETLPRHRLHRGRHVRRDR